MCSFAERAHSGTLSKMSLEKLAEQVKEDISSREMNQMFEAVAQDNEQVTYKDIHRALIDRSYGHFE